MKIEEKKLDEYTINFIREHLQKTYIDSPQSALQRIWAAELVEELEKIK